MAAVRDWQGIEDMVSHWMPRELARAIRDWWEQSSLPFPAAIKILAACCGIQGDVRIKHQWGVMSAEDRKRAEELRVFPARRAEVIPFDRQEEKPHE